MEIYPGNNSLLQVFLFLIISSEHWAVQGGIFNKQNPITFHHDLYKFIEATEGSSNPQSPDTLQQEFHSFIRKTGGAAELQSSSSRPSIQAHISYVPPLNPQGELNEKMDTWERHKRSFQHKQKTVHTSEAFDSRRIFDHTSPILLDFGRLDHIPKNSQTQILPRPREFTHFDFRPQGDIPKNTVRPQTFFRSQKHSHILSKPQERLNPFINQPIDPHRNPTFQNTNHRFITQNHKSIATRPQTKFHHSHIVPPVKSNTKSGSSFHTHSHQFSAFNNRPKNTKKEHNSQDTIFTPHTDHNLAFYRPTTRPVDFSSVFDKPMTSGGSFPESNNDGTGERTIRHFTRPTGTGCSTPNGFRHPGEVWYSTRCRRSKCIAFRGTSFVETDQCDTEIYNTVYKCIIEVDVKANFPGCCPTYRCNPDNLGNIVE